MPVFLAQEKRDAFEPEAEDDAVGAFLLLAEAGEAAQAAATVVPAAQSWLILTDATGYAAELAAGVQAGLQAQGQHVAVQTDFVLRQPVDHIIHLAGLDFSSTQADLLAVQERRWWVIRKP